MVVYNGTSHKITFYNESDCEFDSESRKLVLKENIQPHRIIEAGFNLSAIIENPVKGQLEGIELKGIEFKSVDNPFEIFSEATVNDYFIVSNLFVSASKIMNNGNWNLLTVGGVVYN